MCVCVCVCVCSQHIQLIMTGWRSIPNKKKSNINYWSLNRGLVCKVIVYIWMEGMKSKAEACCIDFFSSSLFFYRWRDSGTSLTITAAVFYQKRHLSKESWSISFVQQRQCNRVLKFSIERSHTFKKEKLLQ